MPTRKKPCAHRWRLDTPNGPKVMGWCRLCGETKTFPTASEGFWYGEPWSDYASKGRKDPSPSEDAA